MKSKHINDLTALGIMDPVKIVKHALIHGASVASILLTAECAVSDEDYDFAKKVHDQIKI